jgi:hypothetical protein
VLASLSTLLESSLELTLAGRNDEDGNIGLSSTRDHRGDEVLVARSVEDGVTACVGLEVGTSNLNGLTL